MNRIALTLAAALAASPAIAQETFDSYWEDYCALNGVVVTLIADIHNRHRLSDDMLHDLVDEFYLDSDATTGDSWGVVWEFKTRLREGFTPREIGQVTANDCRAANE